jgi:hypothetical protein
VSDEAIEINIVDCPNKGCSVCIQEFPTSTPNPARYDAPIPVSGSAWGYLCDAHKGKGQIYVGSVFVEIRRGASVERRWMFYKKYVAMKTKGAIQ